MFKIWQQCKGELVKNFEKESIYRKHNDNHSDKDNEPFADERNVDMIQADYQGLDYDKTHS